MQCSAVHVALLPMVNPELASSCMLCNNKVVVDGLNGSSCTCKSQPGTWMLCSFLIPIVWWNRALLTRSSSHSAQEASWTCSAFSSFSRLVTRLVKDEVRGKAR